MASDDGGDGGKRKRKHGTKRQFPRSRPKPNSRISKRDREFAATREIRRQLFVDPKSLPSHLRSQFIRRVDPGCSGKVRHATEQEAEHAMAFAAARDQGKQFHVYLCAYCPYWHVGSL